MQWFEVDLQNVVHGHFDTSWDFLLKNLRKNDTSFFKVFKRPKVMPSSAFLALVLIFHKCFLDARNMPFSYMSYMDGSHHSATWKVLLRLYIVTFFTVEKPITITKEHHWFVWIDSFETYLIWLELSFCPKF